MSTTSYIYNASSGSSFTFGGTICPHYVVPYVKSYNPDTGIATINHGEFGFHATGAGVKHCYYDTVKVYCFNSPTGFDYD